MSFPSLAHLDTHQGGQELLMAADAWQCEVIIIDTVSRAVGGEENDNDTWLAFSRHTGLEVKRAGLTLIRLDHAGKDERKGQRGGSAKSGDVDAVWRLTKETETLLTLTCEAHRFPLDQAELTIDRTTIPLGHTIRLDGKQQASRRRWPGSSPSSTRRSCQLTLARRRAGKCSRTGVRNQQRRTTGGHPETPPTRRSRWKTCGKGGRNRSGHPSATQSGQVAGWPPPHRGGHRPGQAANGDQDNAL
jgi:hypothetical protein